jgi:hypothetical protein
MVPSNFYQENTAVTSVMSYIDTVKNDIISMKLLAMTMDGDKPTQEGSVHDKAAQVADRKQALKEREKKQIAFIAECTFDDVLVDEKGPKALKGSSSKNVAL